MFNTDTWMGYNRLVFLSNHTINIDNRLWDDRLIWAEQDLDPCLRIPMCIGSKAPMLYIR